MKKICSFLIMLVLALVLIGCGEKITITINEADKVISIEEGQSQKVTPIVSSPEAILEWSSSDETIAKVSGGTISALKPGEVTITVSVKDEKDIKAIISVTVTEKIIYEVKVENKDIVIVEGAEVTVTPTYTKNTTLKWESSDTEVLTVTDGKLKALKAGFATVKVSIVDHPEAYERINVTVVNKIGVDKTEVAIDEGSTLTIVATSDEGTKLVWKSSDEKVATVSDGVITAVDPGEATISVEMEGIENSKVEIKVVVNKILASSVTINFVNNKLTVGEFEQLSATVAPAGADQEVEWSSSDATVASVDATGKVTALKVGTTIIKAVAKDGSNKYYEYELSVYNVVADFELAGKEAMKAKETQTITLTNKTENTMDKFYWSSSDETIATVDQNGLVTALDAGTVTIKVVAQDAGKLEKTFSITITKDKIKIGSSEYNSLSEALEAAKEGDVIELPSGDYAEALEINKNNITLKGPNAGIKGDATRSAEAELSAILTVKTGVSGFKVDGLRLTGGAQILLEADTSNITLQYCVIEGTSKDGVVRGPAEGNVSNIVINYNYSTAFSSYRFLHITNTIDGLEMIGNDLTCSTAYDMINIGAANGILKGKVNISNNRYVNSEQSFIYVGGVGVLDCTLKGNYVENTKCTVFDMRNMREDGAVKILIENNEIKSAGKEWGAIRIRSADYDDNDTIEIIVKDNKLIDCNATDDPRFINNPAYTDGSGKFDKIYTIGKNYYEVNGTAYTDLKDACFGGAAISYESAYATAEEVPGF